MHSLLGKPQHVNSPVNIDDLTDIRDINIDTSLPIEQRMQQYIRQIKNPYCYRCGDAIIRVSFADSGTSLEDRLKQYLFSGGCHVV